jgi:DNA repair protein RecO (recombination protein O)
MLKLSRYLGFAPNSEGEEDKYFDLLNGVFIHEKPPHVHFIAANVNSDFIRIMQSDYVDMSAVSISREDRFKLLEALVEYYKLHVPEFYGLNSLPVLHALFD